ncbi:DEAD/DEAH box helicase, partial [bacterium]|nr:DEAD/DEAH box helicase [bacterium]
MARRSSRPIGFQFPADPPAVPAAERRPLAVGSAATAPARHLAKEGDACPTCGRELTAAERLGPWRKTHAFAGEDARPSPMGPHAPLPEADHASSRALRRAGQRSAAALAPAAASAPAPAAAPAPAPRPTRPRGRAAAAASPAEAPTLDLDSWQGPAGVRARSPRPAPAGELAAIVAGLAAEPGREGCLVHSERLPAREARFADPESPLPESLRAALAADGIGQLWLHQARALDAARRGENLVVVTGTASGKTLCYNLPVFETLLADPQATALYLFPTKALAQDQLKTAQRLAESLPELGRLRLGTYDGDTSTHTRRRLRAEGRLVLSNPDMFHGGILPGHTRWARFFMNLRFVVLDEIHSYRGIFGSNVAALMRRLRRVCRHYGSDPVFIMSSATIGNPRDLAAALVGAPVTLIDEDGSPRGPKQFYFWNPPPLESATGERRSANGEAKELLVRLVRRGHQVICFSRTRVSSELIYRYCRDALLREAPHLAARIRAYRGGYLPEERREIERQLFSGELMAVSSTNALELGIDIGSLDAAILVGLPPTVASTWQQAGRAGRGEAESCAILVGHNDPIDQYLMRHPEFFFRQNPEQAVADHGNPFILLPHLRCAAFELPLTPADEDLFGPLAPGVMEILEQRGELRRAGDQVFHAGT